MKILPKILEFSDAVHQESRYLHWDKLRRIPPPEGLTHREWLLIQKIRRHGGRRPCPLGSTSGEPFWFTVTDPMSEYLRDIDSRASGTIGIGDPMLNPDQKDRYLVNSLVAEAVTSSQLEGAATTREVAKEMIRTSRPPRDIHERMILNNFRAMQRIGGLREKPADREMILELHRILTIETLEDPAGVGRFRSVDQQVDVRNIQNEVFHIPPPANELENRLAAMCDFANGKTPNNFIHPVVRSIILHFWLAYDHPFVDGNGRTARALFYWSMLRQGYWLCEFISISEIIRKAPARYGRAFLYTETDENDLTYFVLYHLELIRRAIDQLHAYVQRKTSEIQLVERRMHVVSQLNPRQQALISHALRHPHQAYTFESHRMSHNVVYQTARTDLLDLAKRGLLIASKGGREWRFTPVSNLQEKLQ
ncbi:MAG: Fic family protein [Planctomycetota bacterium]